MDERTTDKDGDGARPTGDGDHTDGPGPGPSQPRAQVGDRPPKVGEDTEWYSDAVKRKALCLAASLNISLQHLIGTWLARPNRPACRCALANRGVWLTGFQGGYLEANHSGHGSIFVLALAHVISVSFGVLITDKIHKFMDKITQHAWLTWAEK